MARKEKVAFRDEEGRVRLVKVFDDVEGGYWEIWHVPADYMIARVRGEVDARTVVIELLTRVPPKLRNAAWIDRRTISEAALRDVITAALLGCKDEVWVHDEWKRRNDGRRIG